MDLPVAKDGTIPGYSRLYAFPKGWPMWEEDGLFYALAFGYRPGGAFTQYSTVEKEEIPADVYRTCSS